MFELPHLLAWLLQRIGRTAHPYTLAAFRGRRGHGGE
jgi:hypothetical protein